MTRSNAFNPDSILSGLLDWVAIESPSYNREAVNRMVDTVEGELSALGGAIERVDQGQGYGDVLLARFPGQMEGPGILILGHVDTVHPEGTLDGPLPIRRAGDRVYGPGIFDMKGGLYLAVHALRQVLRDGGRPKLPVTVMVIPDEEVGTPSSRPLIEAEARRHRHVLVPEPSREGKLVTGRHAFLRFLLRCHGRPAHAGADNRAGRSAISQMARVIQQVDSWSDFARGVTYSVGVIQGGTFANVMPIECSAQLLCVAPTEADMEEVRARVLGLAEQGEDRHIEVEEGPVRPLFKPHAGTLNLYETARAIAAEQGLTLEHGQFGGGSDGNFTGALEIPTLDGLGVCGGGPHTHEEHLLVSSLEPRCRVIAGLLERLE
ncbi:M20/M25/M40 family metallo-hydrolase [Fodinicurvata halophila]|uniref:M20/M25/M40 family metallo-hydrolase n=1 Tax=Fodinicurvata halophila TaxID=1419723 RepID=A0ABV8UQF4_9PROT